MSALTQVRAQALLDAELGTAPAAGRNLRLITSNGNQATTGTELATAGGYTAGGSAVTFTAATAQTGTPSGRAANNAHSITNMPATTIVGIEIWTTETTPVRRVWGALTANKTTAAGDTLSFPAGSITLDL